MLEATNPSKFPVTAFMTAPNPTVGDVQERVLPLPVQVPAAAPEEEEAAVTAGVVTATAAAEVEGDTAEVAWILSVQLIVTYNQRDVLERQQ
jgi:hypothetical protein